MNVTWSKKRAVNVGSVERRVSLLIGGAVALYALRKSLGHLILLAFGGYLVYRGTTGNCRVYQALGLSSAEGERMGPDQLVPQHTRIQQTVTIGRPPEEVYRFWRQLENLPRFMSRLESVSSRGPRSHWAARMPFKVEWDAEIIDERANEMIAWRSLSGSQVDNAGTVHFSPAADGSGTEVQVSLQYSPPGGALGAAASRLLKQVTAQQIKDDLQRLKETMETGEMGELRGPAAFGQWRPGPA